jgi:hypothetical protein
MQGRGASVVRRTLKLTYVINASCLAKERCNPENENSEKIYIFFKNTLLNGTNDLLKLRPVRKTLFGGGGGGVHYSGVKSQSSFCVGAFVQTC